MWILWQTTGSGETDVREMPEEMSSGKQEIQTEEEED
jgi:hypothetical protein